MTVVVDAKEIFLKGNLWSPKPTIRHDLNSQRICVFVDAKEIFFKGDLWSPKFT